MWQIHGLRRKKYSSDNNETEIDFVLVEKESRKFLKDGKVISWKLQHNLVVVDVKKENLFKFKKMEHAKEKVWKLKEKRNKGKI